MIVLDDRRIIAGGRIEQAGTTTRVFQSLLVAYTDSGAPDAAFGPAGAEGVRVLSGSTNFTGVDTLAHRSGGRHRLQQPGRTGDCAGRRWKAGAGGLGGEQRRPARDGGGARRGAPGEFRPAWLAAGSAATWDAESGTLTVTGAATVMGDPGDDHPIIVADGASALLTIDPLPAARVTVGGLKLSGGAAATTRSSSGQRGSTGRRGRKVAGARDAKATPSSTAASGTARGGSACSALRANSEGSSRRRCGNPCRTSGRRRRGPSATGACRARRP